MRYVVYPFGPKSILQQAGVRLILSDCSFIYHRSHWYGGAEFLGDIDRVTPTSLMSDDNFQQRGREMLRKEDQRRQEIMGSAALIGGDYSILYPTVWSYLTQDRWDDGTPRKTSSVTMFMDQGQLKCVLKDKESGTSLWAAGISLESMFGVLEALLNDSTAVWRQDKLETGTSARVKKPRG